MNPRWRSALRGVVILSGVGVTLAGVLAMRLADWPIYLVFCLVLLPLYLPHVEVLPRIALPIPNMAATIGFLYIGGLPIIALNNIGGMLARVLRWGLPAPWKAQLPGLESVAARRELFAGGWEAGTHIDAELAAEWATFAVGLGARWWIVSGLVADGPPATAPWAMAIAELGGYALWGVLAILPIYRNGPLLPLSALGGLRTALADIRAIVVLALTPFVFLITYGYRTEGLGGAAAWTLSTLGLHFMFKRLNERRLKVEEQNRRLEALNRELEHRERLSAIGKMSSVVSHQILHQLGVIGVYADLVRNAGDATEPAAALAQARANAAAIEGALGDVNRVLTDLLVFSKDLRLNLYEHPLAGVVDECLDDCRAAAAERGVSLRTECPGDLHLMLDKLKMKQAIANVLRNAIAASPRGGEVMVRAAASDGGVDLVVSDQGPGVPEADREAIFTPFFTTKEEGIGLGLAIAREFTEAHGGRLSLQPTNGGPGAHVVFHLPVRHRAMPTHTLPLPTARSQGEGT